MQQEGHGTPLGYRWGFKFTEGGPFMRRSKCIYTDKCVSEVCVGLEWRESMMSQDQAVATVV